MGPKASTPAPTESTIPSRSVSMIEPSSEKPTGAAPSIRSKYLARIGVGETGASMQRYSMTVNDFKVPKWLQGYRPPVTTEERKEGEVAESIASNDSYSLSFVQPKSADEIRRNFFQRMSNLGVWVPQSERGPNSQSSTCYAVIIYDWDDTLLCTSFLNSRDDAMNITSKTVKTQLKLLEDAVVRLLTVSITLGNNYIITNAMKGWVEYSSNLWIPGVVPLLEHFTVVSARHEYEQKYPGDYHQWKLQAFLEMTKLFNIGAVTNLICLGDSNIEIDAAHTLAQCYQNACIKTIKFRDCPNPDELVKQLDLVYEKFEKICTSGKNMTIRLESDEFGGNKAKMDFSINDVEALNKILNPDDEAEMNPYTHLATGSVLTPGDAGGGRKDVAPPNVKVEAKVNRSAAPAKPKQEIWAQEDLARQEAELSDDRPAPEYDIQLRQRVGPEDIYLGLSDMDPSSRHCQDLLVKIKLPGTRYRDIGLDVEKRVLKLQAPKFKLTLALPYSVFDKQGSAKWIADRETLEVALPIDKEDIPL